MQKVLLVSLIIMGLPAVVNAAEHKSLQALIKEAETSGETWTANNDDSTYGGVPIGTPAKTLEVDASLTADDATHDFIVFEKDGLPVAIIFDVISDGKRSVEHLNLACDANGRLGRCYRQTGQKDELGNPIRGSATTNPLSSKNRKMNALLRHELDFWLKGKYRKVAAKSAN